MKHTKINPRAMFVLCVAGVIAAVFAVILYRAQIIDKTEYAASASTKSYTVETNAARGVIIDSNGNTLVYNEQVNALTINYLSFPTEDAEINNEILKLVEYLESQGEEWEDNLPIEYADDGTVQFRQDKLDELTFLRGVNMLDVNYYATAEDCFSVLKEKYGLQDYTDEQAMKIASVRYGMTKSDFSANNPYTLSPSVSTRTIAYIKENSDIFRGVDYSVSTQRKYIGDGTLACHILGVVGSINSEEYAEKKEEQDAYLADETHTEEEIKTENLRSYKYSDTIGKSGIELAFEDYLRGTRGEKTVSVDGDGNITESYSVLPESGGTVQLTIDSGMQEVAENSLAKQIAAVTNDDAIKQGMTAAGAVVVLNVTDGAVLAMASYPDYSLSSYYEDFSELSTDDSNPLWNRCTQNTYSPGSTMKPVIAIAALEEGVITADSYINCTGSYEYLDQTFSCYNKTAHGSVNVEKALQYSCNIFFYEMAKKLGIDKMNEYAELFGLGQKTGIEINESKGILAGYKYRQSIGQGWKAGETLLAAIGQSDNSFTILQLANYCATIANGGTRYTPYLVQNIYSSDHQRVLYEHSPVVAAETNVSQSTLDTVKKGMYLVANAGSCKAILGNLKYKVACKTGTAEKSKIINGNRVDGTDGFLITFGPYENSEIAICVVIENAGSGSSTAQVAADIYNYYFSNMTTQDAGTQQDNTIIW